MTVRELRADDHDAWMELWTGYLSFYRTDIGDELTATTFDRLCQASDGMFALVALDDHSRLVGFAHSVIHPSTWATHGYCYLEDLFVAPGARGSSVARELIEATVAHAGERSIKRVYWHTQQFNGPARSLYDTVGHLTSMVVYERTV